MRVSSTQFSMVPVLANDDFWLRISQILLGCKAAGSQLVLFPEYFSLSWIIHRLGRENFRENLLASHLLIPEFMGKFQQMADALGITIVAGTIPFPESGRIINRSFVFRPQQDPLFQDKLRMTRFEREQWNISPGRDGLRMFEVNGHSCAVVICYDIEFPTVCAQAAQQGIEILLVPSCTDDAHGYWRVRLCAQARTVENQCYVLMASVVGGNSQWSEIDGHFGQGGLYCPSDLGFPVGGIVGHGMANVEGHYTGEVSKELITRIRLDGTVTNLRDSVRP